MSLSSAEEDNVPTSSTVSLQANSHKKRRVQNQRACDRCRQKKIRCDGNPSGSRCSHCSSSGSECIFTEPIKTRGPPKRYVDTLETRLEKMEGMLSRLYPDGDFSQEMELEGWARGFQPQSLDDQSAPQEVAGSSKDASPLPSSLTPDVSGNHSDESASESDSDMLAQKEFLTGFKTLCITPNSPRYFGKSSGLTLVRSAMYARAKASNGGSPSMNPGRRAHRRPEFWEPRPWECDRVQTLRRDYDFPEPELLTSLVAIFFQHIAPMVPLLHRPTFVNSINDGLHLRDNKFGAVVLLVCAIASRYSHDPRNLSEDGHLRNAGWKWFKQVEPFSNSALFGPQLHDLQIAALSVMFIHGTLPPQDSWIIVGIGLRLAQDVGAHRRRPHYEPPTMESELLKRAFWVLLVFDIWTSSYLGRCCAISEENYDVDLPIECDDEYWENADPTLAFKQPPGKPSRVLYFNHLIKINLLLSYTLRTIYSFNKYSVVSPREKGWEEHTVASLDSALNSWFDSVPDHLRWDPQRENQTFFIQSAGLRLTYYFIQITIHRPFIPSFRKDSTLSFPALTICASAARACSHVADALRKRYPTFASPAFLVPTFVSGVILLVSMWGAKRSGTSPDPEKEMQDVRKCMKLLESAESRWTVAGRLRDLLNDLATAGELTVPANSPPSNKREREDSDYEDSQSAPTPHVESYHHRSVSQGSSQYPLVPGPIAQADISLHTPMGAGAEFTSLPTTAAEQEVRANMPGYSVPGTPANQAPTMLIPKAYNGSYVPLYGSSGLGYMTSSIPSTTATPVPPAASLGSTPPLSFMPPPTMYNDGSKRLPLSTGVGAAQQPGISMMLSPNGMYDPAASTPPSTASISSNSSSPHHGFQPSTDLGTSAGGAGDGMGDMLDMRAMEMEFGGFGVPMADKEAMLRHFAPVLLQDGQIGVDRDTMMMWSEMPSTFETQDWDAYMSSMLGLSATNATDPGPQMEGHYNRE